MQVLTPPVGPFFSTGGEMEKQDLENFSLLSDYPTGDDPYIRCDLCITDINITNLLQAVEVATEHWIEKHGDKD